MLKKSNKVQIVKGINIESAFLNESDNSLFLPVVLDKASVRFFNIKKIYTVFLPVVFVDRGDILAENTNFSNTENDGFAIKEKPLHINRFMAQNKDKYFTLDKVSERSSSSSLFRSLYGKNVVSSYGQEDFLGNFTTVTLNSSDSRVFTVITRNSVDSINLAIGNNNSNSNNFSIKIYAENDMGEIVDYFFDDTSYNITDFEDLSGRRNNKFNVLSSYAEEISRGVSLTLRPYNFPIDENISNGISISGPFLSFDGQLVADLTRSEEAIGVAPRINLFLTSEGIGRVDLTSQGGITSVSQFSSLLNGFSSRIILDSSDASGYKSFIKNAYTHCLDNNLNHLNISYRTQISVLFSGDVVPRLKTFAQDSFFSFESIRLAYDDIKRYNFEKDLTSLQVIDCKLELLNDSQINQGNRKYRISLDFNFNEYERADVSKGSIDLKFVDAAGNDLIIDTFFLDANLTEGNFNIVNSDILIWSYLPEGSDGLVFYFETSILQPIRFMFLKYSDSSINLNSVNIGPFVQETSINTSNVLSDVIYRSASDAIGTRIQPVVSLKEKTLELVRQSTRKEEYKIDLSNIINDTDFRSLGYFEDDNTNTSDAILKNIVKNTLVKIEKSGFVNGIFVGFITKYDFLSNLSDTINSDDLSINNNIFKINIKEKPEYFGINRLNASLINAAQATLDLQNFRAGESNNISENFEINYKIDFSLIVLDKNIVEHFGKRLTNPDALSARTKLFDFIFSLNENFNIENVLEIQRKVFKEEIEEGELEEAIRLIFDVANLSNGYVNKSFNISLSNSELSQADITQENEDVQGAFAENNQFITVNSKDIFDYSYESPIRVKSNLIVDIDSDTLNNSLVVKHNSRRTNYSLSLFGPSIVELVDEFMNNNNSFVEESFISFNYAFDKNTTLIVRDENEDVVINKDLIFIKNDNDIIKNNIKLSLSFDENKRINLFPGSDGEYFEKYLDGDFYHFLSSILFQNTRRDNMLIAKHAIIRVCVVLNIKNKKYTILKNVFLEKGRELSDSINSIREGIIIKTNRVDQNIINIPSVFYEGSR